MDVEQSIGADSHSCRRGQSTRVELRCPYLALTIGLDGIEKALTSPEEIAENIFAVDASARAASGAIFCAKK